MSHFCHTCQLRVNASINEQTRELDCDSCGGNIVEALGQGLDTFLAFPPPLERNTSTSNDGRMTIGSSTAGGGVPGRQLLDRPREGDAGGRLEVVQEIVRRVLGIDLHIDVHIGADGTPPALHMLRSGVTAGAAGGEETPGGSDSAVRQLQQHQQSGSPVELSAVSTLVLSTRPLALGLGGLGPRPDVLLGGGVDEAFEEILHRLLTAESAHAGAPPASEECIRKLPRTQLTAEADLVSLGSCGISQEPFELDEVAVSLACGHWYKEELIETWLRRHNTCPMCRMQVSDKQKEE